MDLKTRQSLFSLWKYSFSLVLHNWWRIVIAFIIASVVGKIVSILLSFGIGFLGFGLIMGGGHSLGILIGLGVIAYAISQIISCYFLGTYIHLFDDTIAQKKPSLLEAFASTSFGSVWSLVLLSFAIVLLMIPGIILYIHKMPVLSIVSTIVLFILIGIRWTYAPGYIVLQSYGFMDAMRESWDQTRPNYLDTLLLWIIVLISYILYILLLHPAAFLLVSVLQLPRFATLAILAVLFIPLFIQLLAFIVAVFINRDAETDTRIQTTGIQDWTPPEINNIEPPQTTVRQQPEHSNPQMDKIDF